MLTGSHPFRYTLAAPGGQIAVIVDPSASQADRSRLSEAADAFFRSALSTDRSLRPADALEFLGTCERALQ
jgi:hypothetical protein